ncbi:MAG: hypothetical protein HKM04_11605 [Legionellales bacterium]|nr:hypothetical protein [Legionellales bacterium]
MPKKIQHQNTIPERHVLVMGKFAVTSRKENETQIYIPGIQTCVSILLEKGNTIGIAHFDTPYANEATMIELIKKINKQEPNSIAPMHATLVGGDFGFSMTNTKSIYTPIAAVLKEHEIPFTHKNYSISLSYATLPVLIALADFCEFINTGLQNGGISTIFSCVALFMLSALVTTMLNSAGLDNLYTMAITLPPKDETANISVKVISGRMATRMAASLANADQNRFLTQRNTVTVTERNKPRLSYVQEHFSFK